MCISLSTEPLNARCEFTLLWSVLWFPDSEGWKGWENEDKSSLRVVLHGKKNNINDILHRSGVAIKAQTVDHVWQSAVKTTALFVLLCLSWIRSLVFSLCAGESAMRRSFRVWGHGLHLGQAGVGRAQRWGGTRQGLQQRRRLHRSVRERMSIKSSLLHFTQLIAQRGPITPPAHTIYILIVTAHGTSAECKVLQFRQ